MLTKYCISFLLSISLFSFLSCENNSSTKNLPSTEKREAKSSNKSGFVEMLVEIPAGTIKKYEFDKLNKVMKMDSIDGSPRLIEYLGYPGNYGMIPKTLLPKEHGGDGDPLDIIAIGPPAKSGSLLKCNIIGVMRLLDRGEKDDKLIAISHNTSLKNVNSLQDLNENYPAVSEILKLWFQHYKGKGLMSFEGFGSKQEAIEMLELSKKQYISPEKFD